MGCSRDDERGGDSRIDAEFRTKLETRRAGCRRPRSEARSAHGMVRGLRRAGTRPPAHLAALRAPSRRYRSRCAARRSSRALRAPPSSGGCTHGGGHTGWSRAWIINFWARLEDGEQAHENLRRSSRSRRCRICGSPPAVSDRRQFRRHGRHRRDAAAESRRRDPSAARAAQGLGRWRIHRLRARGGVEVDAAWSKGQLTTARRFVRRTSGNDIEFARDRVNGCLWRSPAAARAHHSRSATEPQKSRW